MPKCRKALVATGAAYGTFFGKNRVVKQFPAQCRDIHRDAQTSFAKIKRNTLAKGAEYQDPNAQDTYAMVCNDLRTKSGYYFRVLPRKYEPITNGSIRGVEGTIESIWRKN